MSADFLHAADIHALIGSAWPAVLEQVGIPAESLRLRKAGPCPACGGHDRFTFDNRTLRGDFICRGCGAGDGFTLLERVHGWSFSEARRRVLEAAGLSDPGVPVYRETPRIQSVRTDDFEKPLDWSDRAESIWRSTLPLGDIAMAYLTRRGCVIPPRDGDLRYLAPSDRYPPTLCARITDAVTARPISLHLTQLLTDGSGRGDRRLLAGHRKACGVIRLWPDEVVTHGLAIAEGIETALAAANVYTPVWAVIDAGNLTALPVLAGIESLLIVADHDPPGIKAAQECARRWAAASCQVRIAKPKTPGADAADVGVAA